MAFSPALADISAELMQASQDVTGAEVGGRQVLLHMKDWVYLELNDTGSFLWEQLQSPQSLASLRAAAVEAFDVDTATCAGPILAFLEDLDARGFIVKLP